MSVPDAGGSGPLRRLRARPAPGWGAQAFAVVRAHSALAALAVGLTVIAVVLVAVISQPGLRRAGYNDTPLQGQIGTLAVGASGCQPEALSPGARAVVAHVAATGPGRAAIRIRIGGAGSYDGTGAPGSRVGTGIVAGIVAPLPHGRPPPRLDGTGFLITMCVINAGRVPLALLGAPTGADRMVISTPGSASATTVGRVRIDDLLSARPVSLWGVLPKLPDRIATATGSLLAPWLAGVGAIVALIALIALIGRDRSAERRRIRVDLALAFALTLATGALWAGITPAFDKTDEPAHLAYVQAVATLGHPPQLIGDVNGASPQLGCWVGALQAQGYRFFPSERPPWNIGSLPSFHQSCDGLPSAFNGAMYQANQPPAYYVLAVAAYDLASAAPLPTRLLFVRMFSVLLAAITVVLTYLLVRELIPRSRWAPRAAALALALQPIFMFNESGVNADALVVAVTAAIALVAARAWRRGLNIKHALALGALTGLGVLSKLNFLTLVPSIALLCAGLWWATAARSTWPARARSAARLGLGGLLALGIYGLYVLINNEVWHRGAAGQGASLATSVGSGTGGLRRLGDFVWQFFLPRLPGRPKLFGDYPIWHDVLDAITARLGWWNDFGFDGWAAILVVLGFLIAALAAVYIVPRARRRPWPPLVALAALALFLVALVIADFQLLSAGGDGFEGRYVFPAMPLWGLLVGCAVAAVPARRRPALTGALATLFVAHTVLAVSSATSVYYL